MRYGYESVPEWLGAENHGEEIFACGVIVKE
jgi:hypothetical protein